MNPTFLTTHWSVVMEAGDPNASGAREALESLCRAYWFPVYGEVRRRGYQEADAKDLTQGFFACLLRRGSIQGASPDKGRFRSFLLGALGHFLADARDRDRALKRGGDLEIVSFDGFGAEERYRVEPASEEAPDRAFDRRWVLTLLEMGLQRLEAEQAAAGKGAQFTRLKACLAVETASGDYQRLAADLGLKPGTVAVAVHRLRGRYREIIREEVQRTVADPAQVDTELRHLFGNG